jgi:hypothetical protein
MSKTFSEKNLRKPTKFSISVFPQLFLFYRVFRFFLAMGVQKHYKKRFTNKSCRKVFQKIDQKIQNRLFLDFFLITYLDVSRWGEFKNTTKKSPKKIWPTLVLFWPPRNQPTRSRSVTFFFECPSTHDQGAGKGALLPATPAKPRGLRQSRGWRRSRKSWRDPQFHPPVLIIKL